jgi:hypothetical protein
MPVLTPDADPFAALLRPPPDETPMARALREHCEAKAKRVSDKIDEELKNERYAMKKRSNQVTVLLLGQSESGEQCSALVSDSHIIFFWSKQASPRL